ncbi:hypothetical protein PUMCH_002448 [Australozyma saopauloensis]|uniref:Uncharacterized protein n=1 Tax=Australozyma saopauloensis TaxID=291208 RepID=A0AAX4H9C1_9ASCO|nr:hypothetical protein PUMCH_002448 [[Candida] saopauloensis]
MSYLSSLRLTPVKETDRSGKQIKAEVSALCLSNSGSKLVTARLDKSIKVWRVTGGSISDAVTIENGHGRGATSICWNPSTELSFATAGLEPLVKIWTPLGRLEREVAATGRCKLVQYSSDGRYLAVGNDNRKVFIYSVLAGYGKVAEYDAESDVNDIKWCNQGSEILVLALQSGAVQLLNWNGEHISELRKLTCRFPATCVMFDVQGRYVAAGSQDGLVYFWRTDDLICVKVLQSTGLDICSLTTDKEGVYICVSFVGDCSSKVYDYESLEQVHDLQDLRGLRLRNAVAWFPSKFMFISTQDRGRTISFTKKDRVEDRRQDDNGPDDRRRDDRRRDDRRAR